MNKPAPKEPSMDEILSSIRQIIADDEGAVPPRRPSLQAAPAPMEPAPVEPAPAAARSARPAMGFNDVLETLEPLALKPDQILREEEPETAEADDEPDDELEDEPAGSGLSFEEILADTAAEAALEVGEDEPDEESEPEAAVLPIVDPDDVAFDIDEPDEEAEAFAAAIEEDEPPIPEPPPAMPQSAQQASVHAAAQPERPRPSPMPDPALSADMAEQLLEPATNAAVRNTFSRLNSLGIGTQGLTIEAMIRDMLRPMLKEWLDEHLPSVVERMVEKEIARISRGE